jgi:hypothetical protein
VARYPEHEEFAGEVAVRVGKREQLRSTLVPTFGHVVLAGPDLTADATLALDGGALDGAAAIRDAEGRVRIKTTPGEHVVRVERRGFVPFETKVRVEPGGAEPTPVLLAPALAALVVVSSPGARVYVDGKPTLEVPETGRLLLADLSPDEPHDVRVELGDHEPFTSRIIPRLDRETLVEAKLVPLPTSAPFEDSFAGGGTLWDLPAAWSASNGILDVRGPFAIGRPRDKRYRDCDVVFNVQMTDPRGAAWVVRATGEGDGYLFYLSGPGGRWPNQLRAYVVRGGAVDLEKPASAPLPIVPGTKAGEFYEVRIKVSGFTIEHWLKSSSSGRSRQIGVFEDAARAVPSGGFGFTTVDGGAFRVNLVSIRPIG